MQPGREGSRGQVQGLRENCVMQCDVMRCCELMDWKARAISDWGPTCETLEMRIERGEWRSSVPAASDRAAMMDVEAIMLRAGGEGSLGRMVVSV
jgi:hypothetical protein